MAIANPSLHSIYESVVGQPQAIELLVCAMERDRLAPAYLFVGPAGTGRRRVAECFIRCMLAGSPEMLHSPVLRQRVEQRNHPDLLWVEPTYLHQGKRLTPAEAAEAGVKRKAPPQIRLEQIRELSQFLSRPTLEAPRSVVVLEAAETMAEGAANGLLKTLEEPGQATLILMAPDVESLLPTLISRCQKIPFRRLSDPDMATVLRRVEQDEVLQHPEILALAQGSPGEAIAHWQQLQTIPPELLEQLTQPPTTLRQALERATQIHQSLDTEAQLWLVQYLQHRYWHQFHQSQYLHHLETVRKQLLRFAQPRLVWEVALMQMLPQENRI
ncbi:DNA polymerase III subunit delta' [Leptolyngbya sp. FACHB-16]|uniref:DNA polymerase III subunit delta' n=1 Tax=unclassified Leptolyngbya TaxID=2650499 RepID=UPI001688D7CA|nr:DNA polymerase III subunit delta' [Leptolyngbya sp. FACHB-16]MBD2154361.1 DNA polymerase III subunit delta' [Leptolyngbya sp. FACHB-16]